MDRKIGAGIVTCAFFLCGCGILEQEAPPMPSLEEVRAFYTEHSTVRDVTIQDNVVRLEVRQPWSQIQRGGDIWARVGPYIYLFAPATQALFDQHPGVAAVQVTTRLGNGNDVARAILRRDALSEIRWRRTLNLLGHAIQSGRENPRRLEELTEWGERHTEFWYSPRYVD